MFFETIKMSLSNLWHNKMRTFLTVLGVIIGIASIIAMMTFVQGATDEVSNQMMSAGANKITVSVMGNGQKTGLTEGNIQTLSKIPNVDYISVAISGRKAIVREGNAVNNVTVTGIDQQYYKSNEDKIKYGRNILKLDLDNYNQVALISSDLATELFNNENPLDQEIQISGISFRIVGILDSEQSFIGTGNIVQIPYTTASKVLNMGAIMSFDAYLVDTSISKATKSDLEDALTSLFNDDENAYSVFDMQMFIEMFNTTMSTMKALLTAIASISLLVGGIGIMNMMLVSVSERTNEIGLRKALGAKPSVILLQFVLEAVTIAIIGGLAGLGLGLGISFLLGSVLDVVPSVTFGIIALAVGFSALVGLVFGILPARRAAKLNPIDALRSN